MKEKQYAVYKTDEYGETKCVIPRTVSKKEADSKCSLLACADPNENNIYFAMPMENDIMKEPTYNEVEHPNHYTWIPGIECCDVVQHFNYNLGTAIAYIWRCEYKDDKVKDLRKAIQHLQFELDRENSDD